MAEELSIYTLDPAEDVGEDNWLEKEHFRPLTARYDFWDHTESVCITGGDEGSIILSKYEETEYDGSGLKVAVRKRFRDNDLASNDPALGDTETDVSDLRSNDEEATKDDEITHSDGRLPPAER